MRAYVYFPIYTANLQCLLCSSNITIDYWHLLQRDEHQCMLSLELAVAVDFSVYYNSIHMPMLLLMCCCSCWSIIFCVCVSFLCVPVVWWCKRVLWLYTTCYPSHSCGNKVNEHSSTAPMFSYMNKAYMLCLNKVVKSSYWVMCSVCNVHTNFICTVWLHMYLLHQIVSGHVHTPHENLRNMAITAQSACYPCKIETSCLLLCSICLCFEKLNNTLSELKAMSWKSC